ITIKLTEFITEQHNNNTNWKALINNTFGKVHNYHEKLDKIWTSLGSDEDTYNYLVYTSLIKFLDPITQLMIYFRQKDMESFNDRFRFSDAEQFLSLFLLGEKELMEKYLPPPDPYVRVSYQAFIDILKGNVINKNMIDKMLIEMATKGSVNGIKYFIEQGGDIHALDEDALVRASRNGHLEAVKFLVEKGANIHADSDLALYEASKNGNLDIVKYLVWEGANVHAVDDRALRIAKDWQHSGVVDFLKSLNR
ncbi:unnamed protein product, partial [marine sediment metagenome]